MEVPDSERDATQNVVDHLEARRRGSTKELIISYEIGPITRKFIKIAYEELEPLDPDTPYEGQLKRKYCSYIVWSTNDIIFRLGAAYEALGLGGNETLYEHLMLVVESDNLDSISSTIVAIAEAYYWTCLVETGNNIQKSQILAGLFEKFLIEAVYSGNNRGYIVKEGEFFPHDEDGEIRPNLLAVRLFVKADLIARYGHALMKISKLIRKDKPIRVPDWLKDLMNVIYGFD